MSFVSRTSVFLKRAIKNILFFGEAFLALRLILKFLEANPLAPVVSFIYHYSEIIVFPFLYIFPPFYVGSRPVEMVTVSAMIGYAFLAFILYRILDLF